MDLAVVEPSSRIFSLKSKIFVNKKLQLNIWDTEENTH
jgi:hypothetical protein